MSSSEEKFIFAVRPIIQSMSNKPAGIENFLLGKIKTCLSRYQFKDTGGEDIQSATKEITALLFDNVYSFDFIRDPVLLRSGYTMDRSIFRALKRARIIDSVILEEPSNNIIREIISKFNIFLSSQESIESGILSEGLLEYFSGYSDNPLQENILNEEDIEEMEVEEIEEIEEIPGRARNDTTVRDSFYSEKIDKNKLKKASIEAEAAKLSQELGNELSLLRQESYNELYERKEEEIVFNKQEVFQRKVILSSVDKSSDKKNIVWPIFGLFSLGLGLVTFFLLVNVSGYLVLAAPLLGIGAIILISAACYPNPVKEKVLTGPVPDASIIVDSYQDSFSPDNISLESILSIFRKRQDNIKKHKKLTEISKQNSFPCDRYQEKLNFLEESISYLAKEVHEKIVVPREEENKKAMIIKERSERRLQRVKEEVQFAVSYEKKMEEQRRLDISSCITKEEGTQQKKKKNDLSSYGNVLLEFGEEYGVPSNIEEEENDKDINSQMKSFLGLQPLARAQTDDEEASDKESNSSEEIGLDDSIGSIQWFPFGSPSALNQE